MSEKKKEILAAIGKEIPGMSETEKSYLIGFIEGFAANQNQTRLERVGSRKSRSRGRQEGGERQ